MSDPAVVEALASRKEDDDGPAVVPIEGFGAVESRLANIEDRLVQLIYATLRTDSAGAPGAARPVYPHKEAREQKRRAGMRAFELQLIPGGE